MVEDFVSTHTLATAEARGKVKELGFGRSYEDPRLKNRQAYVEFVRRLMDLGLIDLSREPPEERAGIFFVKKKGGKQRPIFDCRRSNCHFTTPKTIGRLEVGGSDLYVAQRTCRMLFTLCQCHYNSESFLVFGK